MKVETSNYNASASKIKLYSKSLVQCHGVHKCKTKLLQVKFHNSILEAFISGTQKYHADSIQSYEQTTCSPLKHNVLNFKL